MLTLVDILWIGVSVGATLLSLVCIWAGNREQKQIRARYSVAFLNQDDVDWYSAGYNSPVDPALWNKRVTNLCSIHVLIDGVYYTPKQAQFDLWIMGQKDAQADRELGNI